MRICIQVPYLHVYNIHPNFEACFQKKEFECKVRYQFYFLRVTHNSNLQITDDPVAFLSFFTTDDFLKKNTAAFSQNYLILCH